MLRLLAYLAPIVLVALVLLVAASARADTPALLVPPAVGREDLVWIAGRVLAEDQGNHGPPALRTARRLGASNLEGARVEVTFQGRTGHAVSGHDGEFEVALAAGPREPFTLGPGDAVVTAAGATARVPVHVLDGDARLLVVSDLDDTVAVTNVTSKRGVLTATFLQDETTQPVVAGMADLYRCLVAGPDAAPAVVFVSGSPIQLAPRIGRFLAGHGFPPFALFLRNLGPRTLSGYKEPVLRTLLARFPDVRLVLVGDSGERDPEIYGALRRELPDRVAAVYLRRATATPGPAERFEGALLFDDPAAAARDAAARGLADPTCVARVFPAAEAPAALGR